MTPLNIRQRTEQITASDGYPLTCTVCEPDDTASYPVETILCFHGIQSHAGWYGQSSRRFAAAGFRVLFPDRRGSGANTHMRGDLPDWRLLVSDAEDVLRYFNAPTHVHLLAISWGAKPALVMASRLYPWLRKLALITPGFKPHLSFSLGEKIMVALRLIGGQKKKCLPIPIPGADFFTHTPKYQQFISEDPATLTACTVQCFYQSLLLDIAVHTIGQLHHVPTLMQLASDDRIINNELTRQLFKRIITHPKSTIKEYHGCAHTLEFDDSAFRFVDDIIDFLKH